MHVPLLQSHAVESALSKLPGWSSHENALHRDYNFSDFETAFAFMTAAALHIVKLDHHPEWSNIYSRVRVKLSTHDSHGITERDVELATLLEGIAARFA
jgi:4a-hydroxytetrahydrobiopterin dehydratase